MSELHIIQKGFLMKTRVLLEEETIALRIGELADTISRDYAGRELLVIGVLKGAFIFVADLVRRLSIPAEVDFIGVASYSGTESTGQVRITHDLAAEIKGKDVLLVEDIVEKGITLDYLLANLRAREPRSLKICSFLSKPKAHTMKCSLDYVGFEIDNEFVIGYGLDLDQKYRALPHVKQILH